MNTILTDIQEQIHSTIKENLPNLSFSELEENGKVYYMNGKNGTEFDWYVNEHLPSFMVFYNDEDNLGVAKADVYEDGGMIIYLFDDHGKNFLKEVKVSLDVEKCDLLSLAVCLRLNADEKRIWDASLENIDSDYTPSDADKLEFNDFRKYMEPAIRRKEIMGKLCVVSKKITQDGWKVGYMMRTAPHDEEDSGWEFMAGDEDDDYINDIENHRLCAVHSIVGIDPVILGYIDNPENSRFIRVSSESFEEDKNQNPFMEKWK
ncbi:MAG: DUF2185 domain-containing protein [Eubacterium sp.]|nr:DUF2185 domain-containing protein [Eubacterium sp.]